MFKWFKEGRIPDPPEPRVVNRWFVWISVGALFLVWFLGLILNREREWAEIWLYIMLIAFLYLYMRDVENE